MESQTSGAGTKDWLEATKDMTIVAYIESGILEHGHDEQPFTKERFQDALRKASRPIVEEPEPQPDEGK